MRKVLAAFLVCACLSATPAHADAPLPQIGAPEAIVMDGWTGGVLYQRNADVPRYPASTVKIMTALIVLDSHIPLNRVVTVSPLAASYGGSTAGLYAGEQMTVFNLLHGMLLPSGNDAAVALAEATGGTLQQFVAMMNAKAASLHLWHTHYLSPNGFDTWGQVTTARDLATLARVAMQRRTFAAIVRDRYWPAWSADHRTLHRWFSLNKLLWSHASVDGVKTGTTPLAGACLVSSVRQNGKWIIAVNMGSTEVGRFSDGSQLLNYGLMVDAGPPGAH